jgi:hypothetical protein
MNTKCRSRRRVSRPPKTAAADYGEALPGGPGRIEFVSVAKPPRPQPVTRFGFGVDQLEGHRIVWVFSDAAYERVGVAQHPQASF